MLGRLRAAGHEVRALVRSPRGRERVEASGARAIEVSLFDAEALARAFSGCDTVLNLATAIPTGMLRPALRSAWRANDRVRSDGARAVAAAAARSGVSRLVQESLALAYADAAGDWIDESSPWEPLEYAATVRVSEDAARSFAAQDSGVSVILRFAQFYGPENPHTAMMARMLRAGLSPLPGRSQDHWSLVHTEDAAAAVVAALDAPPGVYNVADDGPGTRRELADAMASVQGTRRPWCYRAVPCVSPADAGTHCPPCRRAARGHCTEAERRDLGLVRPGRLP